MVRPSVMQYLIGALAANAPLMFLLFALTLIEPSTISANYDIVNAIILFSTFGGALLAGFLIEEKAGTRERIRLFPVGMIMGIFCYLLNYVLAMISFIPRTFSEFVTVASFEAGSVLGVFLRAQTSKQPRKKAAGIP
jgi:hypothetical protein